MNGKMFYYLMFATIAMQKYNFMQHQISKVCNNVNKKLNKHIFLNRELKLTDPQIASRVILNEEIIMQI